MSLYTVDNIDSGCAIQDGVDSTKKIKFDISNVSTSTTRMISAIDADMTLVGETNTQTLTNKTINTSNNTLIVDAGDIASGTLTDARVAASNITQHEGSINHDNLLGFISLEHLDWTADQGANNIHQNNITSGSVTQHEGSITIGNLSGAPTGSVIGTTDTQTLTNKTFTDNTTFFQDDLDNTKKIQFQLSGITTGNTRIYAVPDLDTTIVGTDVAQTLSNKTLTLPTISSISNSGTITIPTGTDTLVARASADTLTNKTINSDNNTLTNIVNADIKATAAIDATKIADGSVTNTEFQYINSITSNVQTQIDGKSATGHAHTAANITDFQTEVSDNTNVKLNTAYVNSNLGNNELFSGGVSWLSGLTYSVTPLEYSISGTLYTYDGGQIVLDAADPTSDRIDVIIATSSGTVSKITGTPAPSPVKPDIDETAEIEISFATVAAGATSPSGLSSTDIYLENAGTGGGEWDATETTSAARINLASTNSPYAGTKVIEITSGATNDEISLKPSSSFDLTNTSLVQFFIKSKATWDGSRLIRFRFFDAGNPNGNWINIGETNFGFDSSNTSTYQTISINKSDFKLGSNTTDELKMQIRGNGTSIGYYLDNIKFQSGISQPETSVGEVNTCINIGTGGIGIFKQKTGPNLELKKINAGSSKVTITDDTANNEIDIGITEANIVIGNLSGAPAGTVVGTSDAQTLTNKTLTSAVLTTPQINDTSANHQYIYAVSELVADRTVTLPLLSANDTFVFAAHTQTLTNKTINTASNTITIATADITSGTFADARIAASNVTQHEGSINHDNLLGFVSLEHLDWTADQGANNIHQNNITSGSVTQHEGSITIGNLSGAPTGVIIGTTDTQTLTNKTFTDNTTFFQDDLDSNKKIQFQLSGITTGNTRIYAVPDLDTTIVGTDVAQTLSNKTLTLPTISSISNSGTITIPTGTDTLVARASADTLINKTIDSDNNTITNIVNADIKSAAAIDATKIADSSVTDTEFQYINSLTSNAQTQLDAKATISTNQTITGEKVLSAHTAIGSNASVQTDDVLRVDEILAVGGHLEGIDIRVTADATVAGQYITRGMSGYATVKGTNFSAGSAVNGLLYGVYGNGATAGDTTDLNVTGLAAGIFMTTGVTLNVNDVYGGRFFLGQDLLGSTGVINATNSYVLKLDNGDDGLSTTNHYGLYIDEPTRGTTNYTMYTTGGDHRLGGDLDIVGNITVSGNVDGRDIAADGSIIDSHTAASVAHGVSGSIVGTTDTQTMSGKTWGDNLNMNSNKIINLLAPTADTDATTKAYVDAVATGLHVKKSVVAAAAVDLDSNTSISGTITYTATGGTSARGQITATLLTTDTFTVDSVNFGSASDGSRILLMNQTAGAQNGIWTTTISGTALTLDRATDFDSDTEVMSGSFTFVTEGSTYDNCGYVLSTNDPIIIGGESGTSIAFSQFSGAGQISAGTGLTKTGDVINAIGSTTIIAKTDSLEVNSSVTANQILLSSGTAGTASTFGALPLNDTNAITGYLDATNIADGSVTNTEFQYLNSITSDIQTQIDGKLDYFESNLICVENGSPGSANHIKFHVTKNTLPDTYNLGIDTGDPCKIIFSAEDGSRRQATVLASDGSATATIFGVASSNNSGSTWQPVIVARQDQRVGIGTNSPTDTLDVAGNIIVSGTVDGRDVATDGSTLDSHTAATSAHGISGDIVGTTDTQTLTNKTLTSAVLTTPQINDTSTDHQYIFGVSELVADRTITLPLLTGNDTFVFEAHTQTLTNKTINTASNTITIATGDVTSGTFADARIAISNVTQHEGSINHDNLTGFVANEHIDHSTVSVTAGVGLSGGGTIASNRTIDLDINSLTADASPDGAADYLVTYDASATGHKKVLLNNLPGTDMYDAIVDAAGNGDYTSVFSAFNGGATSVFVRNGMYTETSTIVIPAGGRLVGESLDNVMIILSGAISISADGSGGIKETAGTITAAASTAVVGVGTTFTNLAANDYILIGDVFYKIASITDNTNLVLDHAYKGDLTTTAGINYVAQTMYAGIQISNVTIKGSTAAGIYGRGLVSCIIDSVNIVNCNPNIHLIDCGGCSTINSGIHDSAADGILVDKSYTMIFESLRTLNSGGHGINITNSSMTVTIDAIISNNNGGSGINVATSSSHISITDCITNWNKISGVDANSGTGTVSVCSCTCTMNTLDGVDFNGSDCTANCCIVSDNSRAGIQAGNRGVIVGNHVARNADDGIALNGDSNCSVTGNVIESNTVNGIHVEQDNNVITGNRIFSNSGTGILINATADGTCLSNNLVSGNTTADITDNGTNTIFGSTRNGTETLTNKTINSDNNTITNIANADIKATAGIAATKIADGTVSDTEFQYINTLTSNAQTQLNAKVGNATNIGSGLPIFKQKTGTDLEFKKVTGSSTVSVASSPSTSCYDFENDVIDTMGIQDGTIVGGVTYTTGKVGTYCADFDGVSGTKVNIGTLDVPNTAAFSISCWFNVDSFTDARLVAKADSTSPSDHIFALMVPSAAGVGFRLTTGTLGTGTQITGSTGLSTGTWYHFIAWYDGADYKIYLNGSQDATGSKTGSVPLSDTINTSIGNQPPGGGGDRAFNGKIDQVIFWNKALSAQNISDLYNSGSGRDVSFFSDDDICFKVIESSITLDNVGGTLSVEKGGTGQVTLTSGNLLQGNGTSAITAIKAAPSGDIVGTTDTQTLINKTINTASNTLVVAAGDITSGTITDARIAASNVSQHEASLTLQNLGGTLTVAKGGTGVTTLTADGILKGNGTGAITSIKSNWAASVGPTTTDDSAGGYEVGSRWIDTTADKEYVCLDATTIAAVWSATTMTGTGDVTGPGSATDNAIVRFDSTTGQLVQNSVVTIDDNGVIAGTRTITPAADITWNLGSASLAWNWIYGLRTIMENGTVAQPSYSFGEDPDCGLYRSAINEISLGTAGVKRLTVEADGTLNVAGTINYETLVLADDDVPNKKYVDDKVWDTSDITTGTLSVARGGSGAATHTANAILKGNGSNAIISSDWLIDSNDVLSISKSVTGYILDVHNTNLAGGNGFHIHAGEVAGDISFKITDRDGTFNIMEMEANNGYIVTHKTYAQTLADNGIVYGFDNQHAGVAKDFNTQNGIYRIGGTDVANVAQTLTNKTWGDDINMNSNKIINLATPTADTDAATKSYVDATASGLDVKASVVAGAAVDLDSNSSISGVITYTTTGGTSSRGQITATLAVTDVFTIDGVTFAAANNGSRILLMNQTTGSQNGIWTTTVSGTSLTLDRATDFDSDAEVNSGAFTFVTEGLTYDNCGYVLSTNDPITIGGASGTSIAFSQFSGAGQISAGTGLTKTGDVINAIGSSTIIANADSLEVNSSATANQILLSSGTAGTASTFGALPLNDTNAITGYLDATNIADGSVTNTEFQYLNSITSDIQTQIDSKVDYFESNLICVENGSPGSANHIKFHVTKNTLPDTYNLGIDTGDPCKVIFSTEDYTYRQATVLAGDANATATIFGVARSNDSGTTWQPTIVARQDQRVGIGTNAPTDTLDVAGNIVVSGTVDSRDIAADGSTLDSHVAATAAHGISGNVVGTTDVQTLTNKTIDSTTNTIAADKLHSATTSITVSGATAPTVGQVLTATSGIAANWQTPAVGDVTAGSNLTATNIVVGDDGVKGVKTSGWTIDANNVLGSGFSHAGYIIDVHNTKADGGGNGFRIKAGEVLGDIAFHVADQDDTFQIMEMEADQGFITLGKTYAQTLTDNGTVYGIDIQHPAAASDFNTQSGIYRIGGKATIMGTEFQDGSSDGVSSTTSTTFQQKLRMTTPSLPSGKYRIGWSFAVSNNNASGGEYRVQINDTTTICTGHGTDSSTPGYTTEGGFYYAASISGVQNIDIDYRAIGGTMDIKEARLEIWRVS